MAITQTGAIYKAFSFDNVSSRNYGVYITGEAVYNAPERDVEMIAIPGRNGSFALDNGRFENIEVKYPAGIAADSETDFAQAVSDLRNFLCSKKGYFRLADEYNPNEYRMAVYKSGLEVLPVQAKAGEFEIIFECKPQRFLTSGEDAVDVSSGDTITNPTLFEARPMLEVEGYGNININGNEITRKNTTLGLIQLVGWQTSIPLEQSYSLTFDRAKLNTGDTIYFSANANWGGVEFNAGTSFAPYGATSSSYTDSNADALSTFIAGFYYASPVEFVVGTPKTITNTRTVTATIQTIHTTETATWTGEITYDGDRTFTASISAVPSANINFHNPKISLGSLYGDSTLSTFGTVYIDCDLGEAYTIIDGSPASANAIVSLGYDLPTLASGGNVITYDNTITDLKIIPRWWKV